MYYTDRMKWLRDIKNITQKEIAAYLGIKQQQYARYEKGINVMPVTYLIKLCQFYNISADYILGLTSQIEAIKTSNENVKEKELVTS